MALTKETEIAKIEVVGTYKHVQVRTDTIVKEDDVELSRKYHRHVLAPDADITNEHADVKAICNTVWTDDVKAAWKTFKDNEGI
jgi:hypothetical protein|tara:strand:+ start:459 stop:710 length:252 start_codon:yes stop_codon:yes gene_type:complete